MGRRMDILAWNTAACALFGDYAALDRAERNIARITFLDETSRQLYADWTSCARENVAYGPLQHPVKSAATMSGTRRDCFPD
nr:hypothetical protein [Streptomyces sp. 2231.1]